MAQLPPDGTWLIQQIGDSVVLFHRHTEQELLRYDALDGDAAAKAQSVINLAAELTEEQKAFAHFWCGYFHAHASNPHTLANTLAKGLAMPDMPQGDNP